MKTANKASLTVTGLCVAAILTGCETVSTQPTPADLDDSSQVLTVVVTSIPAAAKVYGMRGETPGSFLGTTPLVLKYKYLGYGKTYGHSPDETLDVDYHIGDFAWDTERNFWRVIFKCFVIADGYLPYKIHEQVHFSKKVNWSVFQGGRREFAAHLQSQQPVVVAPYGGQQSAQQPARDGKIRVTCDVEGAEVFVDGAFVGNSPASLSLSEGTHTVEVRKDGRGKFKREVRVLAGSETSIRAELSQ